MVAAGSVGGRGWSPLPSAVADFAESNLMRDIRARADLKELISRVRVVLVVLGERGGGGGKKFPLFARVVIAV